MHKTSGKFNDLNISFKFGIKFIFHFGTEYIFVQVGTYLRKNTISVQICTAIAFLHRYVQNAQELKPWWIQKQNRFGLPLWTVLRLPLSCNARGRGLGCGTLLVLCDRSSEETGVETEVGVWVGVWHCWVGGFACINSLQISTGFENFVINKFKYSRTPIPEGSPVNSLVHNCWTKNLNEIWFGSLSVRVL